MLQIAALLVALGFFAVSWAQELPGSPGMHIPLGQMKLTDTQREGIRQIRLDLNQTQCGLKERMVELQEDMRQLFAVEPVDEQRLAKVSQELAVLQQQLSELRGAASNRIESLLTAEQREELQRWRGAQPAGPTDQSEFLREYGEPETYPYPPQDQPPTDQTSPPSGR